MDATFWKDKQVFVTGHTGFKGAWLCLLLDELGAKVTGYALEPPTNPSLFQLANVKSVVHSVIGDMRDTAFLTETLQKSGAEIVIHMAAQSLVRESYRSPVETYEVNVMGTVNLLEAVRQSERVKVVINVTTDKCYENKEWIWSYRENDVLGGHDPYSNSKACSELVMQSYVKSFFHEEKGVTVASARAGNVIGGGDWAKERLLVDCAGALLEGKEISIRSPHAVRPWQHVLEPLSGYLRLAQVMYEGNSMCHGEGFNFGPKNSEGKSVQWIVEKLCELWKENATYRIEGKPVLHEAGMLKLDCSKAEGQLNWLPTWDIETTLIKIIDWLRVYKEQGDTGELCRKQILQFRKDYLHGMH